MVGSLVVLLLVVLMVLSVMMRGAMVSCLVCGRIPVMLLPVVLSAMV